MINWPLSRWGSSCRYYLIAIYSLQQLECNYCLYFVSDLAILATEVCCTTLVGDLQPIQPRYSCIFAWLNDAPVFICYSHYLPHAHFVQRLSSEGSREDYKIHNPVLSDTEITHSNVPFYSLCYIPLRSDTGVMRSGFRRRVSISIIFGL